MKFSGGWPRLTFHWPALVLVHALWLVRFDWPGAVALGSQASAPATMPEIRQTGSNTFRIGSVEFDKSRRTVCIPARVRLRNEVVEYALVTEQGKGYESMLTTHAKPADIHIAALLLGAGPLELPNVPGKAVLVPATNAVAIEVSWSTDGQSARFALSDLVQLTLGQPDPAAPCMSTPTWLYSGSVMRPSGFAAQQDGSIISLIRDPAALVNNPGPDRDNDNVHFPNSRVLPPAGTPVRVTLKLGALAQNQNASANR